MYLFAKNNSQIEVYSMMALNDKIKKYRQGVLSKNKNLKVTTLISTDKDAINHLQNATKIDERDVIFSKNNFIGSDVWSEFFDDEITLEDKTKVINNYLLGLYDTNVPIEVVKNVYNEQKKWVEIPAYQMLLTEEKKVYDDYKSNIKLKNIIMLPQNLFFLQCLINGNFARVANEDITNLLKLFNFRYLKSVDIFEIIEILNLGLVDGNITDIENKASIGEKILRRAKVK